MSDEPTAEAGNKPPAKKRSPRKKAARKKVAASKPEGTQVGGNTETTQQSAEPKAPTETVQAVSGDSGHRPSKKSSRHRGEDGRPGRGQADNQPTKSDRESSKGPSAQKQSGEGESTEGSQSRNKEGRGSSNQENRGGNDGRGNNESRNSRRRRGGRQRDNNNGPRQPRGPEPSIDVKELMTKAWHIYSTEICEEGIRFVDDTDALKLVKRSFRLAEIFLKAQPTRGGGGSPSSGNSRRDDRDRDAESKDAEPTEIVAKPEADDSEVEIVPTIGEDALSAADTPDFPED